MAGRAVDERRPPPLLLAATIDVLRRHAPFDGMAGAELELLAARLRLRYFARAAVILDPSGGVVRELFIIQRGTVEASAPQPGANPLAAVLVEGELFPVGALTGRRATTLTYRSAGDTFTYVLSREDFEAVMAASPAFHAFCTRRLAHLLDLSTRSVREAFAARASGELGMSAAVRTVVRRPAVTLPRQASIRTALETMNDQRIGSVVVVDADGAPLGIFTRSDVLDRVALAQRSLEAPLGEVMTAAPVGLDAQAPIAEAAHTMARHGFRHLLVLEGERLAGVVSERDLFALQRRSARDLRNEIERADSGARLAAAARESRELASSLLAQGVGAEPLVQMVTALNDAIAARAVAIAQASHPVDGLGFCWIGLGSEGRLEQTLATDQDNAIIFPDGAPAHARERLLGFAGEANELLATAGFPLCAGDIMARNPRWCLTLGEWRERFDDWMRNSGPQSLMNAAIFFDFRPLAGDAALGAALRDYLRAQAPSRPAFLRQMAENALQVQPPGGFLDPSAGPIDLKRQACRPFVDAARVLALAAASPETNTVERLRKAGPRFGIDGDDLGAAVQSFLFILQLRLRRQQEERDAAPGGRNRVDPRTLNELDRRILKEALRQARKLQNRVAVEYQL